MFVGIHIFKYIKAYELSFFFLRLLGVIFFSFLIFFFPKKFIPQISLQYSGSLLQISLQCSGSLFFTVTPDYLQDRIYTLLLWMNFWVPWEPFPCIPWRDSGINAGFLIAKGHSVVIYLSSAFGNNNLCVNLIIWAANTCQVRKRYSSCCATGSNLVKQIQ